MQKQSCTILILTAKLFLAHPGRSYMGSISRPWSRYPVVSRRGALTKTIIDRRDKIACAAGCKDIGQ